MSPPLPPVLHVVGADSKTKHFPPTCTRKIANIRLKKKKSIIIRIKNTNLPTWVAGSVRLLEGPNGSAPPVPYSSPPGGKTLLNPQIWWPGSLYLSPRCLLYTETPYLLPNKRNTCVFRPQTGELVLFSPAQNSGREEPRYLSNCKQRQRFAERGCSSKHKWSRSCQQPRGSKQLSPNRSHLPDRQFLFL